MYTTIFVDFRNKALRSLWLHCGAVEYIITACYARLRLLPRKYPYFFGNISIAVAANVPLASVLQSREDERYILRQTRARGIEL